jgi:type IV secretion system protein VirB10
VWLGPAAIWQGPIFEAVLTSAVNTDLPGEVTAVISKNIYSSLDGRYLLIPQNSKLYGSYNSSISYSQSRVQIGWHTLIRPDGYSINLGNMAATDAQGAAGVKGIINDHLFQYVKALALMSVFNIINSEFENTAADTDNQYVQNIMANSQSVAATLGSKLIDRAMDVQPAITIKAGLKINIVANTTLALSPLPPYDVTMPYQR